MRAIYRFSVIGALGLLLVACESQQQTPPPMPPTSSPPASSSPPAPPTQSSESKSSPPTQTSQSSKPSMPQPESSPSSPSMPPASPSEQQAKKSETASSSKPSDSEAARQKAAETLKQAGQQVARAGEQIPQPDQPGESGEWDPLMPDEPAASSPSASAEPDDMMMQEPSGGESAGSESAESARDGEPAFPSGEQAGGDLAEDIRAAQEALEKAGIALETAGIMLEGASTGQELADAEEQLANARIAVIVAGQDLLDLGSIMQGDDLAVEEAQEVLNEANVAIVIASESIFSTRISLPEFDKREAEGQGTGGNSELDRELEDSIAIFEAKILDARNEVIGSTPAPTSGENIPGVAVLGGGSADESEGTFEINDGEEVTDQVVQQGRMPEGSDEVAAIEQENAALIPDDIPDPQGDDIVAQQLREAAIAEKDPVLREKLWEEYKRYKAGL